jgi:hypothetical protein
VTGLLLVNFTTLQDDSMIKALELKVLDMCEKLLPKTSERSNKALTDLFEEIRKELTKP